MLLFIKAVWYFLWEVFMGKDKVKTAYRKDRKRFYMFLVLVVLSIYSVFITRRVITISHEHVTLKQELVKSGVVVDKPTITQQIVQETAKAVKRSNTNNNTHLHTNLPKETKASTETVVVKDTGTTKEILIKTLIKLE